MVTAAVKLKDSICIPNFSLHNSFENVNKGKRQLLPVEARSKEMHETHKESSLKS